MSTPDEGRAAQIRNIEAKTDTTLAAFRAAVATSGKAKHGEIRSWLMETYGLGYGDANTLTFFATADPDAAAPSQDAALDEIYAGKKAHLRGVHDAVLAAIGAWGEFEISPKKGYVSLRRKKQFAMLGPKTTERADLGLNIKGNVDSNRIISQPPGGMCQYIVALKDPQDVDGEVIAALKRAFDAAG